MIDSEKSNKSRIEEYTDLARKSLVRTQYSCSGNSTSLEESDFISYRTASVEDIPAIIQLLDECKLPHSDIMPGKQQFIVAEIDQRIIGCVGYEAYDQNGLFRSLAVKPLYQNMSIAHTMIDNIFALAQEQGIREFFLLTTTADKLFGKLGWEIINRNDVPESIGSTTEFSSICPSVAICMKHQL
jgi:amino-acid N-acetyltransferase